MKRRDWDPKKKLEIVLEGLKGEVAVAELCNRHQITQSQYYAWRDRLLADGPRVFDRGGVDQQVERLEAETKRLKGIIGDLTVELKKNDW